MRVGLGSCTQHETPQRCGDTEEASLQQTRSSVFTLQQQRHGQEEAGIL